MSRLKRPKRGRRNRRKCLLLDGVLFTFHPNLFTRQLKSLLLDGPRPKHPSQSPLNIPLNIPLKNLLKNLLKNPLKNLLKNLLKNPAKGPLWRKTASASKSPRNI
ncbi:hypothetical protein CBS63078_864 [Aspergillus niger]|nr:hypothetical protein CBS63078_864 [Aspergillus niger]